MSPDSVKATAGGVFVAVVGPSGAGKDSVISYARRHFEDERRVAFVRRVITRPSDPASEDHDTLRPVDFDAAEARGDFALTWSSHGLRYAIPVAVDGLVRSGAIVIANASRGVIPAIRQRYEQVLVVQITASPDVLAARLGARGREAGDTIRTRLARNADYAGLALDCETIDNSGPLEGAGNAFVALIRSRLRI